MIASTPTPCTGRDEMILDLAAVSFCGEGRGSTVCTVERSIVSQSDVDASR